MAELAQFPLNGGGVLVVEVDPADSASRRVMRGQGSPVPAAESRLTNRVSSSKITAVISKSEQT